MNSETARNSENVTESTANAELQKLAVNVAPCIIIAYSVIADVTKSERLTVTGVSLPTQNPQNVIAIIRDPKNNNPCIADSIVLTVDQINLDSVVFTIRRTDSRDSSTTAIRIDFFVVI